MALGGAGALSVRLGKGTMLFPVFPTGIMRIIGVTLTATDAASTAGEVLSVTAAAGYFSVSFCGGPMLGRQDPDERMGIGLVTRVAGDL